jgi:hypothetical protein
MAVAATLIILLGVAMVGTIVGTLIWGIASLIQNEEWPWVFGIAMFFFVVGGVIAWVVRGEKK